MNKENIEVVRIATRDIQTRSETLNQKINQIITKFLQNEEVIRYTNSVEEDFQYDTLGRIEYDSVMRLQILLLRARLKKLGLV